ncbi:MAG TPA: DUF2812 domain-containing protein [Virgibacillus sp.]|nr:DUF2812 domain-containing protein [Virgibacillus sp.]
MAKKICRPFWSFNIKKTEDWLHTMALEGYRLKKIYPITRYFVFESNKRHQDIRYHIEYSKKPSPDISTTLKKKGWERVLKTRTWYVLCNDKPPEERKTFPIRDGVIKRNRFMMYLFSGLFIYTFLTTIVFLVMCGLMMLSGQSITIQANAFWVATIAIAIILWTLTPISTIKLYRTNHKYW